MFIEDRVLVQRILFWLTLIHMLYSAAETVNGKCTLAVLSFV